MTIIVALREAGQTWIGADSRCCLSGMPFPAEVMKWAVFGARAIGISGSNRSAGLLRKQTAWPDDPQDCADQIRAILKADGYHGKPADDDMGAERFGGCFIYADATGVWDIDSAFAITRITDGRLWARGSGMDYALGVDHALRWTQSAAITPKQRLMVAIAAAIEHDTGCGNPIFVQQLGA